MLYIPIRLTLANFPLKNGLQGLLFLDCNRGKINYRPMKKPPGAVIHQIELRSSWTD